MRARVVLTFVGWAAAVTLWVAAGTSAIAGAAVPAEPGPLAVVLDDFEGREWTWEGANRDTEHARGGKASARWDVQPGSQGIVCTHIPKDWSSFDALEFYLLVPTPVRGEVTVIVETENPETEGSDYFYRTVTPPASGWQRISLPLKSFEGSGRPPGWQQVGRLVFSANRGLQPLTPCTLYLDEVRLTRDLLQVEDVGWQREKPDSLTLNRVWQIRNRMSFPVRVQARTQGNAPGGLSIATPVPASVEIAAGGSATIHLPVTRSASLSVEDLRDLLEARTSAAEPALVLEARQHTVANATTTPAQTLRVPTYLGSLYFQCLSPRKRPWVWFTEGEQQRLKSLVDVPAARATWAENRLLADSALRWWTQARSIPRAIPPFGALRLVDVLNVAAVEKDPRHRDLARGLLSRLASRADWVSVRHRPRTIDLTSATFARSVGSGYDALCADLTEGERIWLRKALLEKAVLPYINALDYHLFPTDDYTNNWCSVVTGGMGVGVLALLDEDPRAAVWAYRAVRELFAILDHLPRDGGWNEGLSYWEYALDSLVFFSEAVRRATGGQVDPFQHPFWRHTGDFVMHNWLPPSEWVNFADSYAAFGNRALLLKLAREAQRPDWAWLAQQFAYRESQGELLFWPTDAPTPPAHPAPPRGALFPEVGWATLRSDWTDEATVLAFRSGPKVPHSHLDVNTFVLHAFGETLVPDLTIQQYPRDYFSTSGKAKYYWSSTGGHNTIVVDGGSQRADLLTRGYILAFLTGGSLPAPATPRGGTAAPGAALPAKPGARVSGALESPGSPSTSAGAGIPSLAEPEPEPLPGCDYILSDAREVYPDKVTQALRHVLHVRRKEGPGYFLIVDELAAKSSTAFEWRAHSSGEIAVRDDYVSFRGRKASLGIFPLAPAQWRAEVAQHEKGERFVSIRPYPAGSSSLLFAHLLVPVRWVPGKPGVEPIPRELLPEIVTQTADGKTEIHVRGPDGLDVITITPQEKAAASLTLVSQDANGRLVRCALLGARAVEWGPQRLAWSEQPATAVFCASGSDVLGRATRGEKPETINLHLGHAPSQPRDGIMWVDAEGAAQLRIPARRFLGDSLPIRLSGSGILGSR